MSWNNRSHFSGQSGRSRQYSISTDGYEGGQHEETSGKKRSSSRLKKSSGKKADADYPSYTTHGGGDDNYSNNYNSYENGGDDNHSKNHNSYGNGGYRSTPYNNGYDSSVPYYGGSDGYNNNSSYNNGGGGYTGEAVIPYDAPTTFWGTQEATRSPMFINTKEVNVYAMPGSQYDNGYNNDQRRRGGGGFFRPAFEAVGHFFDRRFGINDRD